MGARKVRGMIRYKLQAIDDAGNTIGEVPMEALKILPVGGIVVFSVDRSTLDADLIRLRQELHEIGKAHNRKMVAVRAGEVSITWIPDGEGVSE